MTSPAGVYVHIPFCAQKCAYCDFAVFINQEKRFDEYISALEKEMALFGGGAPQTLYVGGGTPSELSEALLERLYKSFARHFDWSRLVESTFEVNPESFSETKAKVLLESGVNRLSFGLQTSNDEVLKNLGRLHTRKGFLSAFESARRMGFANLSLDLIYGLPGQSLDAWKKDLDFALNLDPPHISLYALKVESGTKFAASGITIDDDLQADMYLLASEMLGKGGLSHYEISNFAKPGFESRHNLLYWRNEPTLGLGVSAASYMNETRRTNSRHLQAYLTALKEGKPPPSDNLTLEKDARRRETLMLNLRLKEGVSWPEWEKEKISLTKEFLEQRLASVENNRFHLTPKGWLLSNRLFSELV